MVKRPQPEYLKYLIVAGILESIEENITNAVNKHTPKIIGDHFEELYDAVSNLIDDDIAHNIFSTASTIKKIEKSMKNEDPNIEKAITRIADEVNSIIFGASNMSEKELRKVFDAARKIYEESIMNNDEINLYLQYQMKLSREKYDEHVKKSLPTITDLERARLLGIREAFVATFGFVNNIDRPKHPIDEPIDSIEKLKDYLDSLGGLRK